MSKPNGFDTWIAYILMDEDGILNESPGEPGGLSKWGVSLTAFSDYAKANNLPVATGDDIRNLTSDGATAFYLWFFTPLLLDQVPAAIAYRIADAEVTLGLTGDLRCLGFALGVWPLPTDVTQIVKQINTMDQKQLITGISSAWAALKWGTGGWPKWGHGWTNRRNKAHNRAIAMVT